MEKFIQQKVEEFEKQFVRVVYHSALKAVQLNADIPDIESFLTQALQEAYIKGGEDMREKAKELIVAIGDYKSGGENIPAEEQRIDDLLDEIREDLLTSLDNK